MVPRTELSPSYMRTQLCCAAAVLETRALLQTLHPPSSILPSNFAAFSVLPDPIMNASTFSISRAQTPP